MTTAGMPRLTNNTGDERVGLRADAVGPDHQDERRQVQGLRQHQRRQPAESAAAASPSPPRPAAAGGRQV